MAEWPSGCFIQQKEVGRKQLCGFSPSSDARQVPQLPFPEALEYGRAIIAKPALCHGHTETQTSALAEKGLR